MYWSTIKDVFLNLISVTFLMKEVNTVLLLLAGPHWPCREAGESGLEGLGASGPGVFFSLIFSGPGGLGAGDQYMNV